MPLTTSYVNVDGLHIALIPNLPQPQEGGATMYVPLTIRVTGIVATPEGATRPHQVQQAIGTARTEPLTPKEIYQAAPTPLKAVLRQFVQEAIGEDVGT